MFEGKNKTSEITFRLNRLDRLFTFFSAQVVVKCNAKFISLQNLKK